MKFMSIRDLKTKSSQIWRELPDQKEIIITNNGRPVALLSAINEDNLEQVLAAYRQSRAAQALAALQFDAARQGTDRLTSNEIDDEIQALRSERRR